MLMLTAAINQRYRLGVNSLSRKVRSIRILGNLEKDAADIFKATIDNRNIPAVCHLKNVADETLSLKEAKVRKYSDISKAEVPYIVCCINNVKDIPIDVDVKQFELQTNSFKVPNTQNQTTKRNQHCTYGPFITTFHRDTMFSTKVHTLSPGSMKLWCFERTIGQLNLEDEEDSETQMLMVTNNPNDFDFFLQEPGEVIEHDGGFAHFVMTFNRHDSEYEQWSALVGWEINTPKQIYHSLQVEVPLIEGKDGTLEVVSEEDFMKTCSKVTRLPYSTLKDQEAVEEHFKFKQKRNSKKRVDKLYDVKEKNIRRYAGLKNRKPA